MPTTRHVIAMVAGAVVAAAACKAGGESTGQAGGTALASEDRIPAGGVHPAANALSAPRPAKLNPDAGGSLFASMNCDGCHGGGAVGWVGPSLVDGRWRFGGADEEIFTSIFYGRPKGMPAYGGVIGAEGVWNIVAYIKAQAVPTVVPTTSWLPGGNATATPTPAAPAAPAAEEKASPSPAAQAAASVAPDQMPAEVRLHRVPRRGPQGRRAVLQGRRRQVQGQGRRGGPGREDQEWRLRCLGADSDASEPAGAGRRSSRHRQVDRGSEVDLNEGGLTVTTSVAVGPQRLYRQVVIRAVAVLSFANPPGVSSTPLRW